MSGDSLNFFMEAFKFNRCRITYWDIGNSPYITDEAFQSFCDHLEHTHNLNMSLETLILRGNTALKIGSGLAI